MLPIDYAMTPDSFYQQLGDLGSGDNIPPVETWNPPLSGDIDLIVKNDGSWIHEGRTITRQGLLRTFSRILKREDDHYFLVTPAEKWRIQVESAPFFIVSMQVENPGKSQVITMASNTDNLISLNAEHPLWVEYDSELNPTPYILVRQNLHGLISRNVYNELCELVETVTTDSKTVWQIRSNNSVFLLGESTES